MKRLIHILLAAALAIPAASYAAISGTKVWGNGATVSGGAWPATVDLTGHTPTAGNILVACQSRNNDASGLTATTPSGWTAGPEYGNGSAGALAGAMFWKKSAGNETSVSLTWSDTSQGGTWTYVEIPGSDLNVDAIGDAGDNEANIASATTSLSSGSATNSTATGLAIACLFTDNGTSNDVTAWSGSYNEQQESGYTGTAYAESFLATKVLASSAAQSTAGTITSAPGYGGILVFNASGSTCPATCAGGRSARCITDTSNNSDPNNILYGQSPAVTANEDTVCYDAASALGDTVSVTNTGYPSFASAGKTATDSFTHTINDNGTGEGTPGKYETSFQPVIESVTGIATGQTTADITVTPSGPTEGTVQSVAISKTSYDTYGAPTHAQIRAGVDGNNDNVAWGSEFTKSFLTTVSPGWTFSRASNQTGIDASGWIFTEYTSDIPAISGRTHHAGTIYGDSLSDSLGDYGATLATGIRRQATGGYTTGQIETVFNGDFPHAGDTFVIIQGGVNNLPVDSDPNTAMRASITAMVEDVEAQGLQPIVINISPWKGWTNWNSTRQGYLESYNAWLASTYPDYYVDAYSVLEDPATAQTLLPAYDSGDHLHLSSAGYQAVDRAISAKFDITGTGVLLEGARTNAALYSEDTQALSKVRVTTSTNTSATTDPAGGYNAEKVIEDTATNLHYMQNTVTVTGSTTYTMSVYLKAAERGYALLKFGDTGGSNRTQVNVTLSTCAVSSGAAFGSGWTYISSSGTSVGNGWCRILLTGTTASSDTSAGLQVILASALGTVNYTGDGASGIYVYGWGLTDGDLPGGYIYTYAAPVSRAATSLSRSWNTQTNVFSGYIVARPNFASTYTGSVQPVMTLYKDANNWLKVTHPTTSGRMDLDLSIGGVTASAQITGLTWAAGDSLDIRFRKNATGIKLWVEASSQETTSGVAPDAFTTPPDTIKMGESETGAKGYWTITSTQFWNSVDDTALGALN